MIYIDSVELPIKSHLRFLAIFLFKAHDSEAAVD